VARLLDVSLGREHRRERRALQLLRSEARHGCPAGPVSQTFVALTPAERTATTAWASATTGAGALLTPAPSPAPGTSVTEPRGVTRAAGGVRSRAHRPSSARVRDAIAGPPAGSSSSVVPIALGLLALISAALFLLPLPRFRRRRSG
jgi:hypothetical protein